MSKDFNPRSREGSDYSIFVKRDLFIYFNPRSREGSDDGSGRDAEIIHISIHAPARGATHGQRTPALLVPLFQSTLPRGERQRCSGL